MARPPLILTEKDILEIDLNLVRLLKDSEARCTLLVDQDGRMLARKGFTKELDCETLAALIAGSFASTRAMAKLVGESEFSVLFHQGERDHIHNVLVDDHTILTVIFDDRTTIGMVRVYAKDISEKLRAILAFARVNNAGLPVDVPDMVGDASDALDNMFGGFDETPMADMPAPAFAPPPAMPSTPAAPSPRMTAPPTVPLAPQSPARGFEATAPVITPSNFETPVDSEESTLAAFNPADLLEDAENSPTLPAMPAQQLLDAAAFREPTTFVPLLGREHEHRGSKLSHETAPNAPVKHLGKKEQYDDTRPPHKPGH